MLRKPFIIPVFIILWLGLAQPVAAQYGNNDHATLIRALHSVSEDQITDWMHTMISPEMRGRLAGDVGYDLAAQWAASHFEAWGLKPYGDDYWPWGISGSGEITAEVVYVGHGISALENGAHIRNTLTPMSFKTGKKATLALTTDYFSDGSTSNVVAMIEGSDPILKNEFMIIGAHLDHLGMMPVLTP